MSQYLDEALRADNGSIKRNLSVAECYHVGCPDVLEWQVDGRPDLGGKQTISVDGRIDLPTIGRLRVEGRTVPEITQRLAELADVAPERVHMQVVEFNSQQVYLFGQVAGLQRAVPYRGQETVLDLLQRAGGIMPGAEAGNVHVVRSHVADGGSPEVFRIDLAAIILDHDSRTNIRLQPFDQVYVGENRRAGVSKCLPPCLRPLYETVCGMK